MTVRKDSNNVKYVHVGQLNKKKEREGVGISVYSHNYTLTTDSKVGARIEEGYWKDDKLNGKGRRILGRVYYYIFYQEKIKLKIKNLLLIILFRYEKHDSMFKTRYLSEIILRY